MPLRQMVELWYDKDWLKNKDTVYANYQAPRTFNDATLKGNQAVGLGGKSPRFKHSYMERIQKQSKAVPDLLKYQHIKNWDVTTHGCLPQAKRASVLSKYAEATQKSTPGPLAYGDVGLIKDKFCITRKCTGHYNL